MKPKTLLKEFKDGEGRITVLTGAGISAESGIPTFRGPEGYWTVGSKEYRPEEMATLAMFTRDPWEVWAWYLYRWTVCKNAGPNAGHRAVVEMEKIFKNRFRLVTQNVDGLHLRAGNSRDRTFQIHGNLHFVRCTRGCTFDLFPFPKGISDKGKNQPVTPEEKALLTCPGCGGPTRPHVLWFDECYNEIHFRAESAMAWAATTELLLVVGTAGATNLPMQIGGMIARNPKAVLIDINPSDNPFRRLAQNHKRGLVFDGPGSRHLADILSIWKD
ncbi:SIR2 family NAD-dependent protein deacylase [Desulfospira joergensenii]|uniref:SIR2 family NAD-dependent protein deacylase n=1 Tax=Desulfospira joergensenii TaxID=53329 RepID=UPI0003B79ADF|nr:Sir2 family NAD-dependent protein deacetylase [Desulfospira joergensenii]